MKIRNKKQAGFSLIELMVVISIISILAILGVATFIGTQIRARDTERQVIVRDTAAALLLDQTATAAAPNFVYTATEVNQTLDRIGHRAPLSKMNLDYFLIHGDGSITPEDDYVIFVCKEKFLSTVAGIPKAFTSGSRNGMNAITQTIVDHACVEKSPYPPVVADWIVVNLTP